MTPGGVAGSRAATGARCGTRARPAARRSDGRRPVLVAGGGIAGLAAATGLAERGVRVTLVEAQPPARRPGPGLAGRAPERAARRPP